MADFLDLKGQDLNITHSLDPIITKDENILRSASEPFGAKESSETTVTRILGGGDRVTQPLPNMRQGRRGKPADMVEI